jgi:hypothetical protein
MEKVVIGIVDALPRAEAAVSELQRQGIPGQAISVLLPDKRGSADFAHEHNTKAPEGAIAGAGAGGVLGGTLGLLAGVGTLAIPGLGAFIAAGPLLAALSGAAAGAALGGVAGALVGMGIPEIEAKAYEGKLRGGNVLIAVHIDSPEQKKRATSVLETAGARHVSTTSEASLPSNRDSAHR